MDEIVRNCDDILQLPNYSGSLNVEKTNLDFDFDLNSISQSSSKTVKNFNSLNDKDGSDNDEESVDPTLLRLQLKKNESRKYVNSLSEKSDKSSAVRVNDRRSKKDSDIIEKLEQNKIEAERFTKLHLTQEQTRTKKKKVIGDVGLFGISENEHAVSFERRNKASVFDKDEYLRQANELGEDAFYSKGIHTEIIQHVPAAKNVNSLLEEMEEQQHRRDNFHRRRSYKEEKDVTYINERNKLYNKKLNFYYDPYTREIKENLERGTAL